MEKQCILGLTDTLSYPGSNLNTYCVDGPGRVGIQHGYSMFPTSPAPTDTFLFRACPWFGSFSFFFFFFFVSSKQALKYINHLEISAISTLYKVLSQLGY